MKESGFWRKLRPLMREAAPGIVVERIESWSTPGFPDVSGCYRGREFWLELKIERNNKVKFQPYQIPWLRRRWKAGSRCFVLVYREMAMEMVLVCGNEALNLSKTSARNFAPSISYYGLSLESASNMIDFVCSNAEV